MTKRHLYLIPLLFLPLAAGCNQTETTTSEEEEEESSTSVTKSFSSSEDFYELDPSATSLTLTGLTSGQEVYLLKINPTSSTISSSYAQYISSASGITLTSSAESESTTSPSAPTIPTGNGPGGHHNFIPAQSFSRKASLTKLDDESASSASRTVTKVGSAVTPLTLVVGETEKEIYVDQDSNISTFKQEDSTLRYTSDYCNVWVVDDYFDSSSTEQSESTDKIISSTAEKIGAKFDELYSLVREIFGEESDYIYYYYSGSSFTTASMDYLSDTGTKVNIVIYDIAADYGSSSESGIVGYFYAKDYYPDGTDIQTITGYKYDSSNVCNYSNEGKYFYVDSYYAASELEMVYSTLAHEFQHMIDFGIKTINQNLSAGSAYNEMMSMLCEDMVQSYLGISNDDSPIARLPLFEEGYRYVGLEYSSSTTYKTLLSYSNNYAFGAWLLRNWGGKDLLSRMSSNAYVDTSSIVEAVNYVNSTSYTIGDLLKMYAASCLSSDYWPMTSSVSYTLGGVSYSLKSIDLWNLDDLLTESFVSEYSSDYYKYDGCEIYGYNAKYDIRPYGITLVDVGTVTDSSITLYTGNTSASSSQDLYIMVK